MNKKWTTGRKEVYHWVRGVEDRPLTVLARPDGTLTGNIKEMDGLVRDAWGPIMQKYQNTPEPDPELFMQEYGRHTQHVPMATTDLTGSVLIARLKKISSDTATGLDGWALKELKCLPLRIWDMLAEVLLEVEQLGVWPSRIAEGFIALVQCGVERVQTPCNCVHCRCCQ